MSMSGSLYFDADGPLTNEYYFQAHSHYACTISLYQNTQKQRQKKTVVITVSIMTVLKVLRRYVEKILHETLSDTRLPYDAMIQSTLQTLASWFCWHSGSRLCSSIDTGPYSVRCFLTVEVQSALASSSQAQNLPLAIHILTGRIGIFVLIEDRSSKLAGGGTMHWR